MITSIAISVVLVGVAVFFARQSIKHKQKYKDIERVAKVLKEQRDAANAPRQSANDILKRMRKGGL
jgi:hypothetical protein